MPSDNTVNKHRDPDVTTPNLVPKGTSKILLRILLAVSSLALLIGGVYGAKLLLSDIREEKVLELYVPKVENSPADAVLRGLKQAGFENVQALDGKNRPVSNLRSWTACGTRPADGTAHPVDKRLVLVVQNDRLDCSGMRRNS